MGFRPYCECVDVYRPTGEMIGNFEFSGHGYCAASPKSQSELKQPFAGGRPGLCLCGSLLCHVQYLD